MESCPDYVPARGDAYLLDDREDISGGRFFVANLSHHTCGPLHLIIDRT